MAPFVFALWLASGRKKGAVFQLKGNHSRFLLCSARSLSKRLHPNTVPDSSSTMRLHPSSLQADQPFSGSSLTLSTYMLSHQGFWSLIMLASNLVGGLRPSHLRSFSSLLTTMHTRLRSASVADPSTHPNSLQGGLEASRLGLDPRQNRFHAPLVYHKDYSVDDWPASHTFPVRCCRL